MRLKGLFFVFEKLYYLMCLTFFCFTVTETRPSSENSLLELHRYSEPLSSRFRAICFEIYIYSLFSPSPPLKRKFQNKTCTNPRQLRPRISVYYCAILFLFVFLGYQAPLIYFTVKKYKKSSFQPPMSIMGLFFMFAMLYCPACLAFFRFTAAEMTETRFSSDSPLSPLSSSSKFTSVLPNRHTFRLPSAVNLK